MSGMVSDDATAQVRVEGDVTDQKVEDVQGQNEMGGMPSRQEEALSFLSPFSFCLCILYSNCAHVLFPF